MRRIRDVADRSLIWRQPRARAREYELQVDEEVVATLRWGRGALAAAAVADERWTFARAGFWRPRVTARAEGTGAACAIFRAGWTGGGALETPAGRSFHWVPANLWHTHWSWREAGAGPVVHFGSRQGLVRIEGQVDVEPEAVTLPELDLLVPLGWYLLVLLARDTAEVSASTAGGAVAAGS